MKITGFALLATIAGLPLASCGNLRAATERDLAQPPKLNVGWWLHANPDTKCPKGKVVINVNRKVIDGMDSGLGNNYCGARWWGMSTFAQTIKVVEVDTDVYCATVYTTGEVTSVGGDGPGCGLDGEPQCGESEGYLQQGVVAPFSGGYTMTIESALKAKDEITANMRGKIDDFDGDCDRCDTSPVPCANSSPNYGWLDNYFEEKFFSGDAFNWSFLNLKYWGWIYKYQDQVWVNTGYGEGNQGNIVAPIPEE